MGGFSSLNDLGKRFGKLVAVSIDLETNKVRCRCDCGSETLVASGKLRNGHTRSCGCMRLGVRLDKLPEPVAGARWIALTQRRFTLVDEADYEMLAVYRWYYDASNGYAARTENGSGEKMNIYMHHLLLAAPEIDHANRNKLDNRRANLRAATHSQNMHNWRQPKGANKYRGVQKTRGEHWKAKIKVENKQRYLGTFSSAKEAALAYDAAAREHFGDFAVCNFPLTPPPTS